MKHVIASLLVVLSATTSLSADGPEDNDPLNVRTIPPVGIEVEPARRDALFKRCVNLQQQLSQIDADDKWICQVEVIPRAVEMTLDTNMVYGTKDLKAIDRLLDEADRRSNALRENRLQDVLKNVDHPNLIIGGFRSKIDGSVQPYGLELPENWGRYEGKFRLDVWLHGRGERTSEVGFLNQRSSQPGQYSPANTVVLHPYGRYSNAFKFAGEIDVMEAIEHVKDLFPIDDKRIAIRGFSMGGAGCWQLAVHYPDLWAAANPGAGFSETREFLRFFQLEDFKPTWYQEKLLHWYDCPPWTNNLRNVPTIAYSGEIDRQKQAADVMVAAFQARGMTLPHIIGPDTAHKIHPDSKIEVQSTLDAFLDAGKHAFPDRIDLTTFTLRYHKLGWLSIEGLEQHWKESRVRGIINRGSAHGDQITLQTNNLSRLKVEFPAGHFKGNADFVLMVDQQPIAIRRNSDGSVNVRVAKSDDLKWTLVSEESNQLAKRPGLQGPIDDAFMDAFTFVGPEESENPSNVDKWIEAEFRHAKNEWKRHFRGDVVETHAGGVTTEEIASRNLILFGTAKSNTLIAKIADRLPIEWHGDTIRVGEKKFQGNHVPLLIYPNPLNPTRYVVLNGGFTYREYAYLNNARQVPMLPDWAIVDITNGSNSQFPGEIKAAGFFDEQWRIRREDPKRPN